jgi:hypothetical protein
MKDPEEILADNYLKGLLREDHPGKSEEEIEKIFQNIIGRSRLAVGDKNGG